jgi:hypothetical protein
MSAPWVIDRITSGIAVVDCDGSTFEVPVAALPPGVQEGTVLVVGLGSDQALREAAEARLARLKARSTVPDTFDL